MRAERWKAAARGRILPPMSNAARVAHGRGQSTALRWRMRGGWSWLALAACQSGAQREAPATSTAKPTAVVAQAAPPGQSAREQVLDAKPLPASERGGPCTHLHALIERDDASLQRFAEVTPDQQGAAMGWSLVRSRAEADERSADGTAWELWRVAEREGWRAAALSARSPSGDWVNETEHCFRPDGTLAQLTDTLRTSRSEHGPLSDTITRSYAPDGRVSSSARDVRHVPSGKRADPGTYQRPEPSVVTKLSELPFASLLGAAR